MNTQEYIAEYEDGDPLVTGTIVRYHGSIEYEHGLYEIAPALNGMYGSYTLVGISPSCNRLWNVRRKSITEVDKWVRTGSE